jgi:molecular chaperone DnaK
MTHPVGIDLGTTHSAVARLDDAGRTAMVPNADGQVLTPSVVLFDDSGIVVGREALKAVPVAAGRVARWVKRDMGNPAYSQPIAGQYLPPEAIQACILSTLRSDAERFYGRDFSAVVTVPAFFDEPRRRATAEAASMAGLPLLDIVNEPTAAALAFGEQLGYFAPGQLAAQPLKLLVYDLGGGTFDVTVVDLRPGRIRALATDGDSLLGGYDWDQRLADLAAEAFLRLHGSDPRDDNQVRHHLLLAAEEAKLALSARQTATIQVHYQGKHLPVPVSRQQFEESTADLLYRTAITTRQVLAATGLDWKQIDRVLLVGGSTRMPMVRKMLADMTGQAPHGEVNPDEAVARGAALYAAHLLATKDSRAGQIEVTNVSAHSLGIEGFEIATSRRCNTVLIPRNTPLPARVTRKFVTRKIGQTSIVVQVLEGESSRPEDCTRVGRMVVRGLPPGLPAGSPVVVQYEYGANGRLNVSAQVKASGQASQLMLERTGERTASQIAAWRQVFTSPEPNFAQMQPILQAELVAAGAASAQLGDDHAAG